MINILWSLFYVLIFPGALFTVAVGLLLAGIDRKVVARMQHRIGPPIRQPLYDFLKLIGKETIIPKAANKLAFLGASGADNSLSPAQARSLLDSLLQRGNPEFTSSGRRVISIIGADELEKRFK